MPWPRGGSQDGSPQLRSPLMQEDLDSCGAGPEEEEETVVDQTGTGVGGVGGGGGGGGGLVVGGRGYKSSAVRGNQSSSSSHHRQYYLQQPATPPVHHANHQAYQPCATSPPTDDDYGGGGGEGEAEEEEGDEEEVEDCEVDDLTTTTCTQPLTPAVVGAGVTMPEQNGKRTSEALLGPGGGGGYSGSQGSRSHGHHQQGTVTPGYKLRFQDFVPSSAVAAAAREECQYALQRNLFTPYEKPETDKQKAYNKWHRSNRARVEQCIGLLKQRFRHLVDKANDWLRKNTDYTLTSCETVTWMSTNPKTLGDPDHVVLTKSVSANGCTYYRRGIRLWLSPRPSNQKRHNYQTLGFIDYVPEKEDSFDSLIARANNKLDQNAIPGKVLTVETVPVPIVNGNVESGGCSWSESTNDDSPYAFVLRLFFTREEPAKENIGVKDFIPHPTVDGYEPFSQLIERANTWLKDQTDVRVTNLQSPMIQRDDGPHSETGKACFYSLPSVTNDHPVEFFRILRLAYSRPTGEVLTELPIIYPFTFESFMPELVPPKSARKKERMEKVKEMFQRVNSFLRASDLEVICAETVLNPLQLVIDETGQDGQTEELLTWMVTMRLYLTGQITSSPSPVAVESVCPPPVKTPTPSLAARPSGASTKQKERKPSSDFEHPGPIFLRRVTTGHKPYKMLVAFICIFVSIAIIVVLSVVYSNQ